MNKRDWLKGYRKDSNKEVMCANNKLFSKGVGNATVGITEPADPITIENVTYVPQLSANLLSVSTLVRKDLVIVLSETGCANFKTEECRTQGKPRVSDPCKAF